MNLLLAADLRIVARDVRLPCGFLKRGMPPGGGHFVPLSRLIGREAAAAMVLFGEELDGQRAVELGLAWEAVDDAVVEDRARAGDRAELPVRAGDGRELGDRHLDRAPGADVVHAPLGLPLRCDAWPRT